MGSTQACPQDPGRCTRAPHPAPSEPDHPGPHVHAQCCLIRSAVMCFMNMQMARPGPGEALPWDKKLTLANSKFTACIFIFLILAPSASNWGATSLFSPLFLQPALFFSFIFFIFAAGPSSYPWEWGLVIPPEHPDCDQQPVTLPGPRATLLLSSGS